MLPEHRFSRPPSRGTLRTDSRWVHRDGVRQASLEPDFSTADRAADCAKDPQHDTDHHKDSADGVENRQACKVTDQEKDDAEHNHGHSDPMRRPLELVLEELPDT
jgi:hypothetical protein